MLIAIVGLAGAGKSEAAAILMESGFERVKFAGPLKNMVRAMLADAGFCADDRERMIEGDLKEKVIPELGVTPRHLMVTLGTEWGREHVAKDVWLRLWGMAADRFCHVVVDDVRFPNEVDLIRQRGGLILKINRPGLVPSSHPSEDIGHIKPDVEVFNTGTLEDFQTDVRGALGILYRMNAAQS